MLNRRFANPVFGFIHPDVAWAVINPGEMSLIYDLRMLITPIIQTNQLSSQCGAQASVGLGRIRSPWALTLLSSAV